MEGGLLVRGAPVLRRASAAVRRPVLEGVSLGPRERPRRPLESATESSGLTAGGCAGPTVAPRILRSGGCPALSIPVLMIRALTRRCY
jgi:hypothetical protein